MPSFLRIAPALAAAALASACATSPRGPAGLERAEPAPAPRIEVREPSPYAPVAVDRVSEQARVDFHARRAPPPPAPRYVPAPPPAVAVRERVVVVDHRRSCPDWWVPAAIATTAWAVHRDRHHGWSWSWSLAWPLWWGAWCRDR